MARGEKLLTATTVRAAKMPGRYGDGGGLYLVVAPDGGRKWVIRLTAFSAPAGKVMRRDIGLGPVADVPLSEAREAAAEVRRIARAGLDPVEERKRRRAPVPTFGAAADAFIRAKSSEWRNAKHRAQWEMTLGDYCASIRDRPVDAIDTAAVLEVLRPIWNEKPETAARLRGRIEAVLDAARAEGHRHGENPARWRGHLDKLLARPAKLSRGHHAALPFADMPEFVGKLRGADGVSALALEFVALTAARTGEALEARWSEFDLSARVWTIPADRMKAGREHRVPLVPRAVAVLSEAATMRTDQSRDALVFPGRKPGKSLSNMALAMLLRRLGYGDFTVHGLRSSFRDWAGEATSFPSELAEAALAHVVGNATEVAPEIRTAG